MKILLDTNIILDIALKREPFYAVSSTLLITLVDKNEQIFVTATSITDIYYIAKKDTGHLMAIEFNSICRNCRSIQTNHYQCP